MLKFFLSRLFIIVEKLDQKIIVVEYDAYRDNNIGGMNGLYGHVDIGSFTYVVVGNVSSLGLVCQWWEPMVT